MVLTSFLVSFKPRPSRQLFFLLRRQLSLPDLALYDLPGQGLKLRLQVAVVVHDEVGVGREVRIELPLKNQLDPSFKNNFFN